MYNPKSKVATEFINDKEILETLELLVGSQKQKERGKLPLLNGINAKHS